jgi:hypothetical protein
LFEEFELLASLAFITSSVDRENLQQTLEKADAWGHNFVWAPMGRAAWDGQNSEPIIKGWQRPEKTKSLLGAGFAKGDADYL